MLARRFTIVCLMTTLFGMGLANLVAHSEHMSHRSQANRVGPCAVTTCQTAFR